MTQQIIIATAAFFGMLSVIFGAFGAHALKNILSNEQLHSFEVGVKYQMYHAIVLLVLGFNHNGISAAIYWCFTIGILLFSFSIYGLVLSSAKGKKLRFLGPITPIGGMLLVIGWLLVLINAF
ncbi:DUF423 domain-containing protein [Subsaximicrobium wynnwilliamsii]|jgi:uncharacterized membrane protein YgdD (TMEM256/DUF423 family)|uniref:DUF423 domain-containing protein n=1 Tax=Subsaximicrobium wynnwilliamsii TaxID=291179 RepID=A0A5C6ZL00_9FLAO|nr:DUF423 domain-containing protein [Subsaximicrobium wynnwilliamsii]TXD84613.1 DUF423 domain-containing protein [Subsaximicrobium wynnwilliamsii]TXD90295.1 DUF423 domain-containing protein [Subsaximicrobium wynnwilliamsii]TXE04346.1 DUF423 domain-containing protein [Subsaximicrobium wynnwilliamsii]